MSYYLIIQIGLDQPTTTPFNDLKSLKEYVKINLNDSTAVAVNENVFYTHINEVSKE